MKNKIIRIIRTIAFTLIAALIFTYPAAWISKGVMGEGRSVITITAEGIGKGLDPSGSPFDINEIKEEKILQAAINDAGLQGSMTTQELAQRISINPQVPGNALSRLTELSTVGNFASVSERMVIPNQFTIYLADEGLFSSSQTRQLLKAIMENYKAHLEVKYVELASTKPAYDEKSLLQMDYPEIVKVLRQETDSLISEIDSKVMQMPKFRSQNGFTFSDILAQCRVIADTELNNMESLVSYYFLTKDFDARKRYEAVALERSTVRVNESLRSAKGIEEIVKLYDNSTNYMFPADQAILNISLKDEDAYYAELTAKLIDAKNMYIDAKYEQGKVRNAIEKLGSSQSLSENEYGEITKIIDRNVSLISAKLQQMCEQSDAMTKEYYDINIKDKIKTSTPRYYIYTLGSLTMNFMLLFVITVIGTVLYRLFRRKKSHIKSCANSIFQKVKSIYDQV